MTDIVTQLPTTGQKEFWKSKSFWAGIVTAVLPFVPGAQVWVLANPEAYSVITGLVFSGLRLITKGKVVIK